MMVGREDHATQTLLGREGEVIRERDPAPRRLELRHTQHCRSVERPIDLNAKRIEVGFKPRDPDIGRSSHGIVEPFRDVERVHAAIAIGKSGRHGAAHCPSLAVQRAWYY